MQYLLAPFRIIYKIYYLVFFAVSLTLLYPVLYYLLAKPSRFPKAFIVMRGYAFVLLLFAGVFMRVKGKENIPEEGAYIICTNHTSFMDTFCIYSIFHRYFVFLGKKEIEKWPLFHIFYTSGMNILVDRHSKVGALKALKRMSREIDRGNPLMIFAEGTISKQAPKLGPFKSGAFSMAIQKQVPVLPVTFTTNWKRLQRAGIWRGKAGPGIAEVIIHKPVITTGLKKNNTEQLQEQVRAIINEPLSALYPICRSESIPNYSTYSMEV
jgi:1-acyl-sn-glycerol-3-phosphate acyltransferase